jgi:hypothetical protein
MANGWSRKLSEPVKTENGRILKTLSDVRDLILRLGESEIKHAWWVYAGELLLKATKSGKRSEIKLATDQLCRALDRAGMLQRDRVR